MSDDELRKLDKEVRGLRRKLERSEEQRRTLELVNDQNQSLLRAIRQQSEALLLNILPAPIAERLKASSDVIADSFEAVSVLFADIVGFTALSARSAPEDLVRMLDGIFTEFDRLADERGLEKIKTIGDAYMVAAGLPDACADHAARTAHMALDMIDALARFNEKTGTDLRVRVGIHSGPVVAGVIGRRKFIYDLWGDTVNTASRMESHGVPSRVQITDATRDALPDTFIVEERGVIDVKGKGPLRTWFLTGRRLNG
jgi:adenylate cyclase